MGTSLTGTKIRDTYDALLKVSDNGALDGTLQTLTDGLGNNSALSLSTAGASVGGTLAVSGATTLSGGVSGNLAANSFVTCNSSSSGDYVRMYGGSGTAQWDIYGSGENLRISENSSGGGLVKIDSTLQVNAEQIIIDRAVGDPYLEFFTNGSSNNVSVYGGTSTGFRAFTGGSERMRVHQGGDISFRDSSANEAFYWDASAASLGIGTTSPDNKLHVFSGAAGEVARFTGAIENRGLAIRSETNVDASALVVFNSRSGGSRGTFAFETDSVERMRITAGGSVAIGTESVSGGAKFHVKSANGTPYSSNAQLRVSSGENNNRATIVLSDDNLSDAKISYAPSAAAAGQLLSFSARSTETDFILTGEGTMLLGIASPSAVGGITIRPTGTTMEFNSLNTTPTIMSFQYNSSSAGSITRDTTSTSYNTSSDYRLKEDFQPMEGALDRVDALNPVNFAWKSSGKRVDGFLAHEVAEVVPEAVTGEKDATEIRSVEVSPAVYEDVIHPAEEAILDEEGNVIEEAKEEWVEKVLVSEAVYEEQELPVYQGIDQSKIVPLLVAAIQELRAELNALKQA